MVREYLAHTGKTKACRILNALRQQLLFIDEIRLHMAGLKVRIPKRIWNECDPNTISIAQPNPRMKLGLRLPATTERNTLGDRIAQKVHKSRKGPAQCKVKLWKFYYGGPNRSRKGLSQHEITYEQPCLQPTCTTCLKWHAHLLYTPCISTATTGQQLEATPPHELACPDIDPRILDDTWRHVQSHGQQPPSNPSTGHPLPNCQLALDTKCSPFVSAKLDFQAAPTTPPHQSKWHARTRGGYTARLTFPSNDGKKKFKLLLRERERIDSMGCEPARRVRSKGTKAKDGERSPRCRHTVRLVFGSEKSRLAFGQAVRKVSEKSIAT